jgi:hypothetical protein
MSTPTTPFVHSLAGRLFLYGVVPTLLVIGGIVGASASDNTATRTARKSVLDSTRTAPPPS